MNTLWNNGTCPPEQCGGRKRKWNWWLLKKKHWEQCPKCRVKRTWHTTHKTRSWNNVMGSSWCELWECRWCKHEGIRCRGYTRL